MYGRVNESVHFTARQCELLTLVARGCENDEIASRLHLSYGTVQYHLHVLRAKLGLPNYCERILFIELTRELGFAEEHWDSAEKFTDDKQLDFRHPTENGGHKNESDESAHVAVASGGVSEIGP